MKVEIDFVQKMNTDIEFAERVKNIAKDLVKTCVESGISQMTYFHDYFKIYIKQEIKVEENSHLKIYMNNIKKHKLKN